VKLAQDFLLMLFPMENLVHRLIVKIVELNNLQAKFINKSMETLTAHEYVDLDSYLRYCIGNNLDIEFLAKSYDLIVKDTLKEQIYFKKYRRYRHSRFDEVASLVYYNEEYMKKYMVGLALTTFLWPNHRHIKRFFNNTISEIGNYGRYLEIGPGHGFYMMDAMRNTRFSKFLGIDISPTSVSLTKSILKSSCFGSFRNYVILDADFLWWNSSEKFDAIVMGEVLEHVEKPLLFLKKINKLARNNAYIFITTCVNAPEIDHIYCYRSVSEVEEQIRVADFAIQEKLVVPYNEITLEECEENLLPVNVAYILRKNY
jgi:2-polyprenyl-3-methyl-5-hydroxy-6-metoxy-1,4-benzoquinol methylase